MGTRLSSDSHTDAICVNKDAYMKAFADGMIADTIPFDENINHLKDFPVVHAI